VWLRAKYWAFVIFVELSELTSFSSDEVKQHRKHTTLSPVGSANRSHIKHHRMHLPKRPVERFFVSESPPRQNLAADSLEY